MADRHEIVRTQVVMATADTQYEVVVPKDARDLLIRFTTTADYYVASGNYRWSKTSGQVTTPGTGIFPMLSGEDVSYPGPLAAQTLYFAHDLGASVTAHVSYQIPSRP